MYGYALWEAIMIGVDLYAFKCTKQEEKFSFYRDVCKVRLSWEDCKVCYAIWLDLPSDVRYKLRDNWKKHRTYPADDWTP